MCTLANYIPSFPVTTMRTLYVRSHPSIFISTFIDVCREKLIQLDFNDFFMFIYIYIHFPLKYRKETLQ